MKDPKDSESPRLPIATTKARPAPGAPRIIPCLLRLREVSARAGTTAIP